MIKRVWASYGTLGYRAWERYLDKMAREGWQLRDNGFLGMRFIQTEPQERYHRIIAKPKNDQTPRLDKGGRVIYEMDEQMIVVSDKPKTMDEELAQDEAMRPVVRRCMRRNIRPVMALAGWLFLVYLIITQEEMRASFWSMRCEPLEVILFVAVSLYFSESIIVELLNIFRYYQARSDQQMFEAILQNGKWPAIRKTASLAALFILAFTLIWGMMYL